MVNWLLAVAAGVVLGKVLGLFVGSKARARRRPDWRGPLTALPRGWEPHPMSDCDYLVREFWKPWEHGVSPTGDRRL